MEAVFKGILKDIHVIFKQNEDQIHNNLPAEIYEWDFCLAMNLLLLFTIKKLDQGCKQEAKHCIFKD